MSYPTLFEYLYTLLFNFCLCFSIYTSFTQAPRSCIFCSPFLQLSTMAAPTCKLAFLFSLPFVHCLCLCLCLGLAQMVDASSSAFSVDLMHRDAPGSPFYNPLDTQFQRLHNAFHRSFSRINRFKRRSAYAMKEVQSDVVPSGGEYYMSILAGNPPAPVLGIADTGSDLTWTQCKPCEKCYDQKPPIFDPKQSSTYRNVQCNSKSCNALDTTDRVCEHEHNFCKYTYSYGDGSFTKGNVAVEKFTINSTGGSPVSFPNLVFGCGHNNGGTFDEIGSGIVGLGGGPLSLISQLGPSMNGKFSYCLIPTWEQTNSTSKIVFGKRETVSGPTAVSTPLVDKEPSTYYYLTLEAISVGNKRLDYRTHPREKGNIIIDSGTTLTFLESEFFSQLEEAVEEAVDAEHASDPTGMLSPCFKGDKHIELPVITVHFAGADVKLQPYNTFAKVEEDVVCFTMIPSTDVAIFGNLSQMDFLIEYDLHQRSVSFMPTDCAKH